MAFQKVVKFIQETPDTITLRIKLDKPMSFKCGQFVMLGLNLDKKGATKLVKRAYSIASPPTKPDTIDITIKIYDKGELSPHLNRLKAGDIVDVLGPYGAFVFEENVPHDVVLIAAGAGITPLMSIIRYVKDKGLSKKIKMLYSSKTPTDIIYYDEIVGLGKTLHGFSCDFTITRPSGFDWKGMTGRISKGMIQECMKSSHDPVFYLCGPPDMINGTVAILLDLGVPKERIKKEEW